MTRAPCCAAPDARADEIKADGLKKGPWTPDEDHKLLAYIQKHGHGSWRSLPLNAGLQRCGKSCRLRWTNYLRPDIKRGRFSQDEDQMIVHLHAILGNRWSAIASHLPRRTDNEIKNYWNTHLKKRLLQMGIDPVTHKSTMEEQLVLDSIIPGLRPVVSSNLTHMSQWDSFRAEAEARLSRQTSAACSDVNLQKIFTSSTQSPSSQTNQEGSAASTTFMSSWRAQVAETLRPSFGVVELRPASNPVNFQTFLQDWESSLQAPAQAGPGVHLKVAPASSGFSTYGSPIDVPDLSSGTVSPQYDTQGSSSHMFPKSAQITEKLLGSQCSDFLVPPPPRENNSSTMFSTLSRMDSDSQSLSAAGSSTFSFAGNNICGVDSTETVQFSPRSTLHAHNSDYETSSPSSNVGTNVLQAPTFPYHDGTTTEQLNSSMFNIPQAGPANSFWSRQQFVAMADPGGFSNFTGGCGAAVPAMVNPVIGILPNDIPIPQFEF